MILNFLEKLLPTLETTTRKLREQEDIIYRHIRSGEKVAEIEECYDSYLALMGKYAGDVRTQLLLATIFARFLKTFVVYEVAGLTVEETSERRAAAKRMLLGMRDVGSWGPTL